MATHPKTAKAKEGTPAPATKTTVQAVPAPAATSNTIPSEHAAPKVEGLSPAAPPAAAAARQAANESAKDKILVVLSDNGGIDFGSMREKTKDKFIAALRRSEGDIFPKAAEAASMNIPDEAVSAIFNVVGVAETMLASTRFPPAVAQAAFMWNRKELEAIKNPAKALIAKHARKLRGWEEETTFALVFAQIHFEKMHTLRVLMAEYAASKAAAEAMVTKTPGPQPGDNTAGAGKMPGDISPADSIDPSKVQ